MSKKYDVVAGVGKYQAQDGQMKYINRNVGSVIVTKQGYHKLVLDSHFSPAGLDKDDNGRVWLSLFEPKEKTQGNQSNQNAAPPPSQAANFNDNDIPF